MGIIMVGVFVCNNLMLAVVVCVYKYKFILFQLAYSRLMKHNFQVSMFERLISNNFPSTLLMMQSRMHKSLVPLYSFRYREQIKEGGRITSPSRVCLIIIILYYFYRSDVLYL